MSTCSSAPSLLEQHICSNGATPEVSTCFISEADTTQNAMMNENDETRRSGITCTKAPPSVKRLSPPSVIARICFSSLSMCYFQNHNRSRLFTSAINEFLCHSCRHYLHRYVPHKDVFDQVSSELSQLCVFFFRPLCV